MIFAVTGRGRTAQGCIEVIENFPITKITPSELEEVWATKDDPKHRKTIYLVSINTEDCMEPLDHNAKYDRKDFYANPGKYRCNFSTKFLPKISALFHCIYWQPGFPKYIENKDLYHLANEKKLRMLGVCDVFLCLLRLLVIWTDLSSVFRNILNLKNLSSTMIQFKTNKPLIPLTKMEKYSIQLLISFLVNWHTMHVLLPLFSLSFQQTS